MAGIGQTYDKLLLVKVRFTFRMVATLKCRVNKSNHMAKRYELGAADSEKGSDAFTLIMDAGGFRVERHNVLLQPSTQIVSPADLDNIFIDGQPLLQVVMKKFRQISAR